MAAFSLTLLHTATPLSVARGIAFKKTLEAPRTEQAHLQDAYLRIFHMVDVLLHGTTARTHADNDIFGPLATNILEEVVLPTSEQFDPGEGLLHVAGHLQIILILRFHRLEIDVLTLCSPAHMRVVGIQSARTMGINLRRKQFHHTFEDRFWNCLDLHDLMGGAEAVEGVQERNPCTQRSNVGCQPKVERLLHCVPEEDRKTRGAALHDVILIAKDAEGL